MYVFMYKIPVFNTWFQAQRKNAVHKSMSTYIYNNIEIRESLPGNKIIYFTFVLLSVANSFQIKLKKYVII